MSKELVEQVAAALAANDDKWNDLPWSLVTDRRKDMFRSDARAIIPLVEADAVARERERCAKVADAEASRAKSLAEEHATDARLAWWSAAEAIAAAIRAGDAA